MSASELIKAAKAATKAMQLPAKALADLREVLAHNARSPHGQQVSRAAFVEHLRKAHRLKVSEATLTRMVSAMGKSWAGR